ncbi:hypothetical protein [Sinomonas sp. P10A9]|uniref:CcmD family protein n=1 Tax=Sinomonas puerhi TaxID=3238584 RepID=A0AB39L6U7_9MICC
MQNLFVALAQTPQPSPEGTLRPGLSEDMITPGTWGFIATAFVVVLTIFLIVDMVRRLRRLRYKAQVEEASAATAARGEADMQAGPEKAADGNAVDATDARDRETGSSRS